MIEVVKPQPGHISTQTLPDGRTLHRFSKSWLGTFYQCPEKARNVLAGTYPDRQGDAAFAGNVMHDMWQDIAETWIDMGEVVLDDDIAVTALRKAVDAWHEGYETIEHRHSIDDPDTGAKQIARCAHTWWINVPQILNPDVTQWRVEQHYTVRIHEDNMRVIEIVGSPDLDDGWRALDHKTGAAPGGLAWKAKRYDLQATIYTWMRWPDDPDPHPADDYDGSGQNFTLIYVPRQQQGADDPAKHFQRIDMRRGQQHRMALLDQMISIAVLIEANLPVWPKTSDNWPCSARWCALMREHKCLGAHRKDINPSEMFPPAPDYREGKVKIINKPTTQEGELKLW